MTAKTIAKIAMQIAVTIQKTRSIRPRSTEADGGSHGMRRATADTAPPIRTPITISWKSDPLRTEDRDYSNDSDSAPQSCN